MNRTRQLLLTLLLTVFGAASVDGSAEVPGKDQEKPIALVGGTIHPVSGPVVVDGTIVFDGGRITALGKNVPIPDGAEQVDIQGKHVYPGLIDSYSNIGLVEISAVRATRDFAETGSINPNVKAQVAVNPDSEIIPVTRSGGVLLALSVPQGGVISGTSSLLQLDGWSWEDMSLAPSVGMHVRWPRMSPVSDWWMEQSEKDQLKQRDQALTNLRRAFDSARDYLRAKKSSRKKQAFPIDSRWEAMVPVLTGKVPLIVQANEIQQIQAAVAFAKQQQVKLIIYGGYDALHCAELLKENKVSIILGGVYRLPRRRFEDYDAAYTLASRLRDAGIQFCISCSDRMGASNIRNLPYHAAVAAAHGLTKEEALRSITLSTAQILGVADRVGSLEIKKDATLIVTDGDPLDSFTRVKIAYIQGRKLDLNNRHKRLWKKYEEKYRRLKTKNK